MTFSIIAQDLKNVDKDNLNTQIQNQNDPHEYWFTIISLVYLSEQKQFEQLLEQLELQAAIDFKTFYKTINKDKDKDVILPSLMALIQFQLTSLQNQINQKSLNIQENIQQKSKLLLSRVECFDSFPFYFHPEHEMSIIIQHINDILITPITNEIQPLLSKLQYYRDLLELQLKPCDNFDMNRNNTLDIVDTFNFIFTLDTIKRQKNTYLLKFPDHFKNRIEHTFFQPTIFQEINESFQTHLLPYLIKLDHFLQCAYIETIVYAYLSHPSAETFVRSYCIPLEQLPPNAYSPLITSYLEKVSSADSNNTKVPDDSETTQQIEQIEAIIDKMGQTRQDEFQTVADLIYYWRNKLDSFFNNQYNPIYPNKKDFSSLLQSQLEIDSCVPGLKDKKYKFKPQFQAFHDMSMREIFDQFNNFVSSLKK